MRILARPPLAVRIGRHMPRSYRVRDFLQRHDLLDAIAPFRFHDRTVMIPLDEHDVWNYPDLSGYDLAMIRNFAAVADGRMPHFDFIDCGAHLGLFSAQFARQSHNIGKILAFEPNRRMLVFLEDNIRTGGVADVTVLPVAVGGFSGKGRLMTPDYDTSSQALYVGPDPDGDIDVLRLDDVADRVGPSIALKLDIEGAELDVLRAAAGFIRSRQAIVICMEMHRKVLARVGRTDMEVLAEINAIRPLRWVEADAVEQELDPRRSIWEQISKQRQCDLIGFEGD